ncbi:hypothetical protein BSP239C_03616 [Brevibacterium sp. 239c]|nr:hypothetical protein BSP239C_03616 [Brevibacterium sp. 239c]
MPWNRSHRYTKSVERRCSVQWFAADADTVIFVVPKSKALSITLGAFFVPEMQ